MTGVLEAPVTTADAPVTDAAPRRRGWARLRADLRLARRQVRRTKGSSALVMLLVMLPVACLAGGAIFWQSHIPSAEQSARLELGSNQAWIQIVGGPDPSRWQSVDQPWDNGVDRDDAGDAVNPEEPAPTDPFELIPPGASVAAVVEWATIVVETETGIGQVAATAGDVWAPSFDGRYVTIEGATPTSPGEAMASPGLLERVGARIGDEIVLADSGEAFTITGTIRRADARPTDPEIFLPSSAADLVSGQLRWFTVNWQPDLDELADLNRAGFIAYAHDLAVDPPAGARVSEWSNTSAESNAMLMIGLIVVAFSGYLIILLAGAAFAVAARRQQRSLAVAASVGASHGDVFRIVVLQGTVLGAIAGLVGVVLGATGAWALLELTDSGAVSSFWGNWGYNVPWPLVAGIVVFAIVVGTLSAVAPARAATRGDVIGALRGSRRPPRAQPKRPLWGLLVMLTGLGVALAGGLTIAALNLADEIDYSHPLRSAAMVGIVVGPIVFQVGFLIAGRWVLDATARPFARLGLSPRIAARDAAANPSRVVPAFAAITVCVFIASFVLGTTALSNSASARQYWYNSPLHSMQVTIYSPSADGDDELVGAAEDLLDSVQPTATALIFTPRGGEYDPQTGLPLDPDAAVFGVAGQPTTTCADCGGNESLLNGNLMIVDPDDLAVVLDQQVAASALAAYRDGAAIVTDPQYISPESTVTVTEWTERSREEYYNAMNVVDWADPAAIAGLPDADVEHDLAAHFVDTGRNSSMAVFLSPEAARDLGADPMPSTLIGVFDEPLSTSDIDRVTADAASTPVGEGGWIGAYYEDGPDPTEPWLLLILGVAGALVLGASAVCLGLTRFERRPDDATLTAVGATPAVRRSVNLWQAVIIVGIGSVVGTAAGLVPVWGMTQTSGGYLLISDAPWALLGVLAVGLPIAIALVNWLVPPRHPDLTRRTAIA